MNPPNQQLATRPEERSITYRAFGSDAEVKLSVGIVRKLLCKPTRAGVQPSDADCTVFMMMCQARALNPFERDAFLVGYDGRNGAEFSIITAISAFLKRAEASEDFDGIQSGVIVKDAQGQMVEREGDFTYDGDEVHGGWAKVFKKNVRLPFVARLNLRTRYKDNQFWNNDKAGMIVKCAESDALRTAFPTKLGGLYIEPEQREAGLRDVTPRADGPSFTSQPALTQGSGPEPRLTESAPAQEPEIDPNLVPTASDAPAPDDRQMLVDDLNSRMKRDAVPASAVKTFAVKEKLVATMGIQTKDYPIEALQALDERWSEVVG